MAGLSNRAEPARLVETNFTSFWSRFDRGVLGIPRDDHDTVVISSRVPSPIFNLVIARNPELTVDAIREIIDRYRQNQLPFRWVMLPSQTGSALVSRLETAGLVRRSTSPAMVLALDDLKRSHPKPPNLHLEPVLDFAGLEDFTRTLNAADFHAPEEVARELPALLQPGPKESRLGLLVGRENARPVATSLRFCSEGAVGIYAVSTLLEARGRGIGSTMTYDAIEDGREASHAPYAVLVSTTLGFPVYRRLGFEVCGEFATYVLPG